MIKINIFKKERKGRIKTTLPNTSALMASFVFLDDSVHKKVVFLTLSLSSSGSMFRLALHDDG